MSDNLVREFYTSNVSQEWHRLDKDAYHRLEFTTTLHFLLKYLPPEGSVLDAGGGPGRYTLELLRRGYAVSLLDFVQANLDFATRQAKRRKLNKRLDQTILGSLVDLSIFPTASFDAVLCLGGPLSHILDPHNRARAVSELVRIARPSAPIFVSVMGRFSVMVVVLTLSQAEIEMEHFDLLYETGDYLGGHGFTACHFFLPEEFRQAFIRPDLEILEMAGLQGLSANHSRHLNLVARNETRYKIWYEKHLQTCTHPSVVGMSEHMLLICRKI